METLLLQSYIDQVKRYPLLSAEREAELSTAVQNGDEKARNDLVQGNLRLVVSIAKKYCGFQVSLIDMIQEGNIGLITAASRYKTSFNTRFSTYAYLWISQAILRFVRNKSPLISLPHRKEAIVRKINAIRDYLYQQCGHEPSYEELSVYMGIPVEQIHSALQYSYSLTSLDAVIDFESDKTVGDFLADSESSPENEYIRRETKNNVHELINTLPEIEREVLTHRYNFTGNQDKNTLRHVGSLLGISSETVRQMEMRAIKRLRKTAEASGYLVS
jgi:RNA polymerase primary sigma factor